jgi:hypothetical protein
MQEIVPQEFSLAENSTLECGISLTIAISLCGRDVKIDRMTFGVARD